MPSSGALNDAQEGRIKRVIMESVKTAGKKGLVNDVGDSLIHDLVERLTDADCRLFLGGFNEKFDGFKDVLRQMERSEVLVVARDGEGKKRTEKYFLPSMAKEGQPSSINRSRSGTAPPVYVNVNGAVAA